MSKKYIEADALIERAKRYCKQWSDITGDYKHGVVDAFDVFMSAIFAQPAADVVEVVRCKDCKHYKKDRPFYHREDNTFHLCAEIGRYTSIGDYCNYGERKDG